MDPAAVTEQLSQNLTGRTLRAITQIYYRWRVDEVEVVARDAREAAILAWHEFHPTIDIIHEPSDEDLTRFDILWEGPYLLN